MKKLLSLVLALCMMAGCVALAEDVTGLWYGDMFGLPVTMNLEESGTYTLEVMGEADSGTWVLEGDVMYMDKGTDIETAIAYDAEAVTLTIDEDGMIVVFTREAVEAFVPAEPRTDAALEEFAGQWEASNVYFMEMLVTTEFAEMFMKLDIVDAAVTMTLNTGEEEDDVATIEGVFADGAITLTIPAEDEWSEDAIFVVKLLEDGMMSCETEMYGMAVIFYLEAVIAEDEAEQPEELTTPVVENPHDLVGTWVEIDGMGTLTINADGTAVMNYSDGTVYELPWQETVTGGEFTGGMWWGSPMELQLDGSLSVDGGWMVFIREGEEYVGGADDYNDYDMPEAEPIGSEGEPYFGTWTMDMGGMAMNLTLNQDGTCTMEMLGEVEPGVWSMVDGKANVMGDELYIDGDGNLVMPSAEMVFVKSEGEVATEEMSDEEMLLALLGMLAEMEGSEDSSGEGADAGEFSYLDTTFVLTSAVYASMEMPVDDYGEWSVCFNSDGTAEMTMSNSEIPADYLTWTTNDDGDYVVTYGMMGMVLGEYTFTPEGESLVMDNFGTMMTFTPAE